MKKISSILACSFICLVILCLNSCDKTSELEKCKADPMCEYFRCNVDGKPWKPYCESSFLGCDAVDVQYYRQTGSINILAKNESDDSTIKLKVRNFFGESELPLYKDSNIYTFYSSQMNFAKCDHYVLDTLSENLIIFTNVDTSLFLIEGQFFYKGVDSCGKSIVISDGQFRQHYRF